MALDPRTLADAANETGEVDPEAAALAMELATTMSALKDRIQAGTDMLKDLRAEYDNIRLNTLPEAMNAAGMIAASGKGSFTLADGRKINLTTDMHVYLRAADRETFFAWLREQGHGDLIKEQVNAQTLKAFTKEQIRERQVLPEYLEANPFLKAVIRKA